jgi:hypothetical protein
MLANGALEPASTENVPVLVVGHVAGGDPALYQLTQPPVDPFPLTTTDPLPASRYAVPRLVIVAAAARPGIIRRAVAPTIFAVRSIFDLSCTSIVMV